MNVAMSKRSEIQEAERDIRIALRSKDAMTAMISFYEMRPEAEKLAFVAALVGRVVLSEARNRAA
ncbi:hypothetical protein [Bradyrhizobium sp. WU425]|uniref:hypothetical protein n=1 Tax=Bradyrhizobium sp. WU425 TaxID=187029 RepID=UPI001E495780|nr:hypothetical protein [Bradyrhizobium canariense]UFW75161.1 hypothetical protein BcanWU425_15895 [Bradyrhizobium canariense]